ncbi:hypothetical protein CP985_03565 [Malaciobacter mytili LMG 24559]|uniref:Carbamoyltransferase n=1 Tax=Malaciobacter mytili LMG 24559 TaxID=1032238 RepID=A0AAX2AHA9_9BACT|nr:carbamoyltransferase C-terminal domain-containing protein [Malaciobacter mytili]AXH15823.1 carbamoyltransferase, NodU family [Malaciobacter mytili LMG 24559]RXK16389.1 hypothetical protein CP985_03565 [Malaciobacter mytili LMG 24559]
MKKKTYFLSIYAHIGELEAAYKIVRRHDQCMALWYIIENKLTLVRYWEFERLSGIKNHGISFSNIENAKKFIIDLLSEEGLKLEDIDNIIGTPGLETISDKFSLNTKNSLTYHSLCHLYTGLFIDSSIFYKEKILCLALDAGPDHVLDLDVWEKDNYLAAYVNKGVMTTFSVDSPAILWAFLREYCNMQEGTLMALGNACLAKANISISALPKIFSLKDRNEAYKWFINIAEQINSLTEKDEGILFENLDLRFSFSENKTSMLVKIIQTCSVMMIEKTICKIIDRFNISPSEVYLSLVGGFALNCPANAQLMNIFKFKGFKAPPVVNDSGMALGIGLIYAHLTLNKFEFSLDNAYYGRKYNNKELLKQTNSFNNLIEKVEKVNYDKIVSDIIDNPIVWFDGSAEIGPRALGHRSLLADPRYLESKDKLNDIKQRQWWRPVAPIVLLEFVHEWFNLIGDSPFMLQAVDVIDSKKDKIPAVCHLDKTARIQTITSKDSSKLYEVIQCFYKKTGVPMLCNTSLNAKDEPIIDTLERAILFALEKNIKIVYLNGYRIQLRNTIKKHSISYKRTKLDYFIKNNTLIDIKLNPYNLAREELVAYFSDPRLMKKYDLTKYKDVCIIRRHLNIEKKQNSIRMQTMLSNVRK